MQEASHIKGKIVELLPPPPLATSWIGTFHRQLPTASHAVLAQLAPCRFGPLRGACTCWLPPLSLPPPPETAVLQLDLVLPRDMPSRSSDEVQQLRRELAAPGIKPWPCDWEQYLAVHVPPLELVAEIWTQEDDAEQHETVVASE